MDIGRPYIYLKAKYFSSIMLQKKVLEHFKTVLSRRTVSKFQNWTKLCSFMIYNLLENAPPIKLNA